MVCLADKNLNSDNWQVLAEYDGSAFANRYVYGNYIDEVLVMDDGTNYYYYLHDHLHSPAALLDDDGIAVERYEYDAYGKATIYTNMSDWDTSSPTTADASAYGNPYLFTGRRLDAMDYNSSTTVTDLKLMYYRNRYCDTHTGRFITHDPLGITPNGPAPNTFAPLNQYTDGANLYEYLLSQPTILVDSYGLWGTMVHRGATSTWAQRVGYTRKSARAIGSADEAVDGPKGTGPKGPILNQSYHFNRNINGGKDTRLIHYSRHFFNAKLACFFPIKDKPVEAAKELGTALHPYQDIEAHGDFGLKERYITIWHNSKSPQTNLLTTHGDPGHYPDDPSLDVSGPIHYRYPTKLTPRYDMLYDYYIYVPGRNRYTRTRRKTVETLKDFLWHVRSKGGCKCKKYFLEGC